MKTIAVFVVLFVLSPCYADQAKQSSATPAPKSTSQPKSAAKSTKSSLRTEAELSGFSSDVSDQFYSRINVTNVAAPRKWWIKAGYGFNQSRTYSQTKIYKTNVFTYNLDTEYRHDGKNGYKFISGLLNIKYPSSYKNLPHDVSGYYMFSVGRGKTLSPGIECEVALAQVTVHKQTVDRHIGIVYALRSKTPLNPSTTIDSDMHFIDPLTSRSLMDSRINMTYKLTKTLSMRLTYTVNNIVGTALYRSDWDKSVRAALVFSRVK
ncbi:hypothetical protein LLG46_00520 [bacterium]|nr:hypothetical protein [bacterium]